MNRLLDALAAWVMRDVDWEYFCADTHALVAEIFRRQHFIARMHANPHFRAVMRDLADK